MYQNSLVVGPTQSVPNSEFIKNTDEALSQLNMNQLLMLDDVFKETKFQEVYKYSENVQRGLVGQYAIKEPGLLGFTRTRDIMLHVPIEIVADGTNVAATIDSNDCSYPDFGLLNIFSRIECFLGSNRQPIGRYSDTTVLGLKRCAAAKKISPTSASFYGIWGPSHAKTYIPAAGFNKIYPEDNVDVKAARAAFFDYILAGVRNGKSSYKFTTSIPLPLYMISGFFSVDSFLPPNLPLEFIFHYNTENVIFYKSRTYNFRIKAKLAGCPKVVYAYSILNEAYQKQIASMRVDKRLLYNYECWEAIDCQKSDFQSKTSITSTISLSQVCPTQLCLAFYTSSDSLGGDNPDPNANFFSNSLCHLQANGEAYGTVLNYITELSIEMEGRLTYRYLNQDDNISEVAPYKLKYFPNAYDILFSQMNERSYRNQGAFYETQTQESGTFSINNPFYASRLFINLTPNAIADTGSVNGNLLARSIVLTIRFRYNINADLLNLNIAKRVPTQLVINSLNETFNYSWPHLATDKNSYIISTVNAQ